LKIENENKFPNKGIGFSSANALYPNALEKQVEGYLVKKVKEAGGIAAKWVSPGRSGVPDRIVFRPGGKIIFVELKRPGEKPTPLQNRIIEILRGLGADVRVVDSMEKVDEIFS
jgi:hypothetical protein